MILRLGQTTIMKFNSQRMEEPLGDTNEIGPREDCCSGEGPGSCMLPTYESVDR